MPEDIFDDAETKTLLYLNATLQQRTYIFIYYQIDKMKTEGCRILYL